MRASLYKNNKENINNNSKSINQDKITINSITDLLKIPIYKLNHSKLENFSGDYFDKIYQEAINSENLDIEEPSSKDVNKSKSKKKNIKEKKVKKIENNNNDYLIKKNKKKKKSNVNEKSINHSNNNNIIIDKKDFYVEEYDGGQPEPEPIEDNYPKKNKYISKQSPQIINTAINKSEKKNNIIKDNNNNAKQLKYKQINKISQINYKQKYNTNNNITPFGDERHIYMYGQMETPGNEDEEDEDNNNDFYIKNNYYMTTPTPTPDDKEGIEENVLYPLIKIIFSINYNSTFGEEVCILGSSPKLGMWKLSGALPLKWNVGNVWKGEIKIEVDDLQDFEFKFVIVEKGKIKYWEAGDNNVVNFTGLINQFQFNRVGRYNKYEYEYNPNKGILLIKCHWKK